MRDSPSMVCETCWWSLLWYLETILMRFYFERSRTVALSRTTSACLIVQIEVWHIFGVFGTTLTFPWIWNIWNGVYYKCILRLDRSLHGTRPSCMCALARNTPLTHRWEVLQSSTFLGWSHRQTMLATAYTDRSVLDGTEWLHTLMWVRSMARNDCIR